MPALKISIATAGILLAASLGFAAVAQDRVAGEEEAKKVQAERSKAMKSLGGGTRALKFYTAGRGSAEDADRQALLAGARRRLESVAGRRNFAAHGLAPPTEEAAAELLERAALGALAELLDQRGGPA